MGNAADYMAILESPSSSLRLSLIAERYMLVDRWHSDILGRHNLKRGGPAAGCAGGPPAGPHNQLEDYDYCPGHNSTVMRPPAGPAPSHRRLAGSESIMAWSESRRLARVFVCPARGAGPAGGTQARTEARRRRELTLITLFDHRAGRARDVPSRQAIGGLKVLRLPVYESRSTR
jgi:hypothetical protein